MGCEKTRSFCHVLLFWSSSPLKYFVCIVVYQEGGDAVVSFQEQHGMEPSLATPVSTFEFAKFALHRPFTAMMIRRLLI